MVVKEVKVEAVGAREPVRMWKERRPAGSPHLLERPEVGTGQDVERTQAGKGHSPAGGLPPFAFASSSHIAFMPGLNSGGLSCAPAWTAAYSTMSNLPMVMRPAL